MTAATFKSAALTAQLVTDPRTTQPVTSVSGAVRMYHAQHTVATANIDEIGDVILLVAIPSSAVVHDIRVLATDLDTHSTPTLAYDVGLYNGPDKFTVPVSGTPTTYAADAVIDADAFASAITNGQSAVNTAVVNQRFEATGPAALTDAHKKMWELVGMDKDPNKHFVIGLTMTAAAATAATGTILIQVLASH